MSSQSINRSILGGLAIGVIAFIVFVMIIRIVGWEFNVWNPCQPGETYIEPDYDNNKIAECVP